MKLETVAIIAKATCFVTIGFFTPFTVGLAQWANSGEWPGKLIWIITFASCMVGAASQLLSFLSGSYSDYLDKKADPGSMLNAPPKPKPAPINH